MPLATDTKEEFLPTDFVYAGAFTSLLKKAVIRTAKFLQLRGNNPWKGGNQYVGGEKELFQIGLLLTNSNREGITAFSERAGKLLIGTAPSVGEMQAPRG